MEPVVVRSVADEFAYLESRFGPYGYRLVNRSWLEQDGKYYDRITVQLNNGSYQEAWFVAAWIPPVASAGQASTPTTSAPSMFAGALVPALVLAGLFGLAWLSRPEEKHREMMRRMEH